MGTFHRLRGLKLGGDRYRRTHESARIEPGSGDALALKREIGRLRTCPLPCEGDEHIMMPPSGLYLYWAHVFHSGRLRLVYDFDEVNLTLISISRPR